MAIGGKGKRKKPAPGNLTQVDGKAAPGTLEAAQADDPPPDPVENWADKPESEAYKEALELYPLIYRAYDNREDANQNIEEYWNIYNAVPDDNQQYMGSSQTYIPAVRDAISARAKRVVKQLFPSKTKHVDAVGTDAETPYPQLALLEQYIRQTKLKDIVRSDLIAGDVTGQWNLYIDWTKSYRTITKLVRRNPIVSEIGGEEMRDPTTEEDETEDEEIFEEGPDIVDFPTEDLAVVPPTVNDLERARVTAIKLRLSKDKCQQLIDEGVFIVDDPESDVRAWLDGTGNEGRKKNDPKKQRTEDAGIKTQGTLKFALIYEAHAVLNFGTEDKPDRRLAFIYFAGSTDIIGIIRCPFWGGKRPILSAPAERQGGSFHGISRIEAVKFMQWNLNDAENIGQDSAMYSLLPVVMTDPLKNPNYQTMVLGMAAVWATSPNDTKFVNFPQLWESATQRVGYLKAQIRESLDVNEMMMGQTPKGRKNNAMIGAMQQEQSVGIMDHAERYEETILTPLAERMFEYDCQFRTKSLTVLQKGETGVKANMMEIPPQQWGERFFFQWAGTSIVQSQQRLQNQIAWMNVLRGIPPQQLNGRRLDVTPIIELGTENIFGPELTPKILIDERNLFTIDPSVENEMLQNGLPVDVHESDDDVKHIESHQQAARLTQDLTGGFRAHIAKHMMQLNAKRQKAMMQAQGQQGAPGGAAPGMAGSPRPGAQPGPIRGAQNPPGAVQQDNMAGAPGRG